MGLGNKLYELIVNCDSIEYILIFLGYLLITFIFSRVLKTNHKSFWWMFFFTIPVGAIITILLDIKDNTEE